MGGYMGRIGIINLTTRTVAEREFSPEERRKWLGGSGLGAMLLMEAGPQVDPFGPENPLIFMTGPMTGTAIPGSGRHQVVTKSPLTGIYGEADAGGRWGTMLKRSGFDGLMITGQADQPVYLHISEQTVDIRDAGELWGLDTYETDQELKQLHGNSIAAACIGLAGEKQALIATIIYEGKLGRSSGRGGLGAVMGSKRLKAIVADGKEAPPVYDEALLQERINAVKVTLEERTQSLQTCGTAGSLIGAEKIGDLPVKNWSQGTWVEVDKISGQAMAEKLVKGKSQCHSCPVGCGQMVKGKSRHGSFDGKGPEYETLGMFGGACLVSDLDIIAHANELCNRYGLDTISAGSAIAFLMDLYEQGIISVEELAEGQPLNEVPLPGWGNGEALIWLIHAMGKQEGIGRLLAQGVKRAADIIGGRAPDFAFHVKGLEMPAHDPRAFYSLGLGYATSNRGACHLQGGSYFFEKVATLPEVGIMEVLDRFREDNQGLVQSRLQDTMGIMDSLKLCKFLFYGGINLTIIAGWLCALTGDDYTVADLLNAGERIFNIKRLYNIKCGITRADDNLPRRILEEPRPDGGAAGNLPPLAEMLAEYYQARGWDSEGRPTLATLERLSLSEWQ